MSVKPEKFINSNSKECYRNVSVSTPFTSLDFHVPEIKFEDEYQVALHTNLGSITVLDRLTGFGWRDNETGFRAPDGKFWLASGNFDVRELSPVTMGDAINLIKSYSNTCQGQ